MDQAELGELDNKALDESVRSAREALNEMQDQFISNVLAGSKHSVAAREAGYSARSSESTAARLLRNAKVCLVRALELEKRRRIHHVDMNWLMRQHLENIDLAKEKEDTHSITKSLSEIAKLTDLYPDQKTTLEIIKDVDFTSIDDNYWSALVAFQHDLVPPAKH